MKKEKLARGTLLLFTDDTYYIMFQLLRVSKGASHYVAIPGSCLRCDRYSPSEFENLWESFEEDTPELFAVESCEIVAEDSLYAEIYNNSKTV